MNQDTPEENTDVNAEETVDNKAVDEENQPAETITALDKKIDELLAAIEGDDGSSGEEEIDPNDLDSLFG